MLRPLEYTDQAGGRERRRGLNRREFLKLGTTWMAATLSLLVVGCGGEEGEENGGEEEDDGGGY